MSTSSATSTAKCAADPSESLAAVSICSVLKQSKGQKHMHWWFFGPVLLAIVMFLLMGTIFEQRIEALWRRILERRQAALTQTADNQVPPLNTNSLHTVKTPSQRTLVSGKACPTTTTAGDNEVKLETKSFCYNYNKKDHNEFNIDDFLNEKIVTTILKEKYLPDKRSLDGFRTD